MTELQVLPTPAPAQGSPQTPEAVSAPTILVTEHEVAFGSAAVLGVRPKRIHWWNRASFAAVRLSSVAPTAKPRQKPRDIPRRYGFLEDALMAREMGRL